MGFVKPTHVGLNELAGSPRESLSESSGSSAERKFLVPMNMRIAFCQQIVSDYAAYPHFPQSRVVAIDLQPWSGDEVPASTVIVNPATQSNDYGGQPCLITVKYGPDYTKKTWPSEFPKPSHRYGTELRYQIRSSSSFLTIPCSATKWEDDATYPVPEDTNAAVLIPMRDIQLQWDFVDNPPITRLEDLQGRVNTDSFLGAPAECLLFDTYEITETFRSGPLNPHTNRVTINLKQRKVWNGSGWKGWNHDYRETPAGWAKLLLSDDQPRYKLATFEGMFA